MNEELTAAHANRLAIGLARSRRIRYEEAEALLRTLSLRIVIGTDGGIRAASQAALLTALNTAHRAFLGGVEVSMPKGIPLKLPIPGARTLDEALALTGYAPISVLKPTHSLYLDQISGVAKEDDILVHCDSWRAGVSDVGNPAEFVKGDVDELSLGGVMAGAMAVHRAFVRATNLPTGIYDKPVGISLWNPNESWLRSITDRQLHVLPRRFWNLGLGHLGQAFLWNLALLPFPNPSDVDFLLQDFDVIDASNRGSGLLCDASSAGRKKTRHCAGWLERFGFETVISERPFGPADRRNESDPGIALCGFDRAEPRTYLETAGFGLVIECGLGGTLGDFDQGDLHVFPSDRHTAQGLWAGAAEKIPDINPETAQLFGNNQGVCGALAIDVAGRSVSTSFVGAMVSSLAISELLRTFNNGGRFDEVIFDARNPSFCKFSNANRAMPASLLGSLGFSRIS
jgi:hypothetical protein